MSAHPQWTAAGISALAFTGIALMTWSAPERPPAAASHAGVDPRAAAGVVTSSGPEVSAAFASRVAELEARLEAAPADRAALLELARLLHDGHRTRDALPLYERAIELDPEDAQPYYDLASAQSALGDWANARSVLKRRLARAPLDAVALYDLGAVEANAGESDAAARWWEQAKAATTDAELRARVEAALSRLGSGPEPPRPR